MADHKKKKKKKINGNHLPEDMNYKTARIREQTNIIRRYVVYVGPSLTQSLILHLLKKENKQVGKN